MHNLIVERADGPAWPRASGGRLLPELPWRQKWD